MKKKQIILLVFSISFLFVVIFIKLVDSNHIKDYKNQNINFKYDSTWHLKDKENPITLEHSKSKSQIKIYQKDLEEQYISIPLKEIVTEIRYSIEKQNSDYKLINTLEESLNSYSYLYEKEEQELLLYLFKQDEKLVIFVYEAPITYYDIVLDSVESILKSLSIE